MKLGTIACLHGSIGNARKFAARFRKENVDAVALVGDIGADEKQRQSLIKIIKIFSKLNKKIFVTPGNHEQYTAHYSALEYFMRNKNIIDCTKNPKINFLGRRFVFIPGSGLTSAPGAGFRQLPSRKFIKPFVARAKKRKEHFFGKIKPIILSDFIKLLGKNAIVINHSPIKFRTETAIDLAEFGEPSKTFVLIKRDKKLSKTTGGIVMRKGHVVFTLDEAKKMRRAGYPIAIKTKNVGDELLKSLLKKKKVSKFICGDIHEAGGRANDWKGKQIKQNKWSEELFFNCAAGKDGRAGVVEFLNNKARYKVVRV